MSCISQYNSKLYVKIFLVIDMYQRLKDLREDNDYKQIDIAKILNMTQQQYSKIENGITEITADRLIKLSIIYDVSVDYLLGLTNNKR